MRYYDFSAWELLTEEEPNFDPYLDPKCTWAVRHPEFFPVEINTAPKAALLRIPGIGPKSALRILSARRQQHLGMAELKRMGVVLKRAQYFITCNGRAAAHGTRQEIAAFPLILLERKASSRLYLERYFLQNGLRLNPEIELGARSLLVDLAAIGFGVAGVTEEFVHRDLESGRLKKLNTSFEIPARSVDMCLLNDVPQSAAAERFTAFVKDSLSKE